MEQDVEFPGEVEGMGETKGQRQRSQTTTVCRLLLQMGPASIRGDAKVLQLHLPALEVGSSSRSLTPQQSQLEVGHLRLLPGSRRVFVF